MSIFHPNWVPMGPKLAETSSTDLQAVSSKVQKRCNSLFRRSFDPLKGSWDLEERGGWVGLFHPEASIYHSHVSMVGLKLAGMAWSNLILQNDQK